MTNQEERLNKLIEANEKREASIKRLIKTLWALVLVMVVSIFSATWYLGGVEVRIANAETRSEQLRESGLTCDAWNQRGKRLEDVYNMVFFKKDTRFLPRGAQMEIE